MANIKCLVPFILKWEGGFVDDPIDRGGATNKGVTLTTYRYYYGKDKTAEDLKNITDHEWDHIFRVGYWDKWQADQIKSQDVANILVDWVWTSGKWGIIIPQRILGVDQDGVVGAKTLAAVNMCDPDKLFARIKEERMRFIDNIIAKNPSQKRFERGWKNRINDIKP